MELTEIVEKAISMKNVVLKEFEKRHPFLGKMRAKAVGSDKRVGLRIMDDDHKVLGEYTMTISDGYLDTKYEEGLNDVLITGSITKSLAEEVFTYEDEFKTHPVKATGRVMKLYAKAMKKGDMKFYKG